MTTFNGTDPERGPGMLPDHPWDEFVWPTGVSETEEWPSASLRPEDVPSPTATWREICWFALHLNAYQRYGFHAVLDGALASAVYFEENGVIDPSLDLDQLRSCLFAVWRASHWAGHLPTADGVPYIRALVEAIRSRVEARAG